MLYIIVPGLAWREGRTSELENTAPICVYFVTMGDTVMNTDPTAKLNLQWRPHDAVKGHPLLRARALLAHETRQLTHLRRRLTN